MYMYIMVAVTPGVVDEVLRRERHGWRGVKGELLNPVVCNYNRVNPNPTQTTSYRLVRPLPTASLPVPYPYPYS